jgi:hypothetical protein
VFSKCITYCFSNRGLCGEGDTVKDKNTSRIMSIIMQALKPETIRKVGEMILQLHGYMADKWIP